MSSDVYLFWDNSNIFLSTEVAVRSLGRPSHGLRNNFQNLFKLAIGGRKFAKGYAVGSIPPETWAVWNKFALDTGISPELFERGAASGKEQAVDQALQVHMLRTLADSDNPAVAVLLTGDGKGFSDGVGFHSDLARMHKKGWGIEVISWNHSCAGALKTWASQAGEFIPLDNYMDSVTFQQNVTNSKPLNLKSRPYALPKPTGA